MTAFTAEQFAYMPASTKQGKGYQVVAQSPGVSSDMLKQLEAYMLPAGVGRGFSGSKSLMRLRGGFVAYSNITNVGDGYDGRPDALYNHTLILSEESFAGVGFDTRALDAYFVRKPARGTLPRIAVEGGAPAPDITQNYQHLVLPVLRALFEGHSVVASGVNDSSFIPNVLAMLPHSMRVLPFSTCLPDHAKQPAYQLATYGGLMRSVPDRFVHLGPLGGASPRDDDLDDAIMFLMGRAASAGELGEVLSEFDRIASSTRRSKLILLSKIFGVSKSPPRLQSHRASDALAMLRGFDAYTQSRLTGHLSPFLGAADPPHAETLDAELVGEKITANSIARMLDGVPEANKNRLLKAVYRARGPDFEKGAGDLLADIRDSPHAQAVYSFFAATEDLHPRILEFLSGSERADRKRARRVQSLLLSVALEENSGLAQKILACGAYGKHPKEDARDLLGILRALAESRQAGSAPARDAQAPGETGGISDKQPPITADTVSRTGGGGAARKNPARRFRDPIHGFIDVYENEMSIIQDPVFQRLRRIKQLSFAHLVYHGAEHSRFGHVLGTMHLADRALRSIKANSENPDGEIIDDADIRTARMAALLHDVGHRPLSHTLDPVFEESHEDISKALVMGRFAHMIEGTGPDRVDPKLVADLIQRRVDRQKPFLAELISGQLDVDKMDYLLRDSHHAGVKYGTFDLDMLVGSLVLAGKKLTVSHKGIMAAEQMIIARYHMFRQVYHHKTKRSFENMATKVAAHMLKDGALEYPSVESVSENADGLTAMDDAWLMKVLSSNKDDKMAGIVDDLWARKPFEEVLNSDNLGVKRGSHEGGIGYFDAIKESVSADLESAGLEPQDIIMDRSSILPYRLRPYSADSDTEPVLISYPESEQGVPIEQRSRLVKSIARDFVVHRMFVRKPKADDLRKHLKKTHSL